MFDRYRDWLYKTKFSELISGIVSSKIPPNLITIIGLIFGLVAAYLIYKRLFLVSIILLIISSLCDICDGWVARKSKRTTKFGIILDVTIDKYVEGFIGLAFAFVAPYFFIPGYVWVVIAVFGSIIISVISNIGMALTKEKPFKLASRFDRGVLVVIGLILARFFGNIYLTYTLVVVAMVTHLTVVSLVVSYYKILTKVKKYNISSTLYNKNFFQNKYSNLYILPSITRFRKRLHFKKVINLVSPKRNDVILEIGCGNGELLKLIKRFSKFVYGIDINPYAIKSLSISKARVMGADKLTYNRNFFDKVVSMHTIEHIKDLNGVFYEIKRVLKPSGICVLIYPWEFIRGVNTFMDAWRIYGNPLYARKMHVHRLYPDKLKEFTDMQIVKKGIFLAPYPTYYTVLKKENER